MMPEKVIHQTWKTSEIPSEYAAYVESVKRLNPGYEYRLWTDIDNRLFIQREFPWFLDTYDSYKHHIERVDSVRYFILYRFGGVYIDLDMECLKPIDELFTGGEIWFSKEAGPRIENQVTSNAFMAAPKAHPFFEMLTQGLGQVRGRDIDFQDVFRNTGPNMLHKMIRRSLGTFAFVIIDLDRICPVGVLGELEGDANFDIQQARDKGSYSLLHHNTESWNIQLLCPEIDIEGYTLLRNHDLIGEDIDYVEYDGSGHDRILDICNRNKSAIGFNYNGYIKGAAAKLEPVPPDSSWLKRGVTAWVYIKDDFVDRV